MLDYSSLHAIAMIAQTGSFEKAARILNVTPSAISQRVKHLEERLGTVLIVRGSPCTATPQGEWLCRHIERVSMLEQDLLSHLPGLADPDGPRRRVTLHVATNADSLATWFIKAVSAFSKNSDYLLNIAVDDQDHTAQWLKRGRVLAAVTSLGKPVQGCHVTPLGSLRYLATASPDFMRRHFRQGVTLENLASAPALIFGQKDRLQDLWIRQTLQQETDYPTHCLPSVESFVEACLSGMGWCMNPEPLVRKHLQRGELIELVPETSLDVALFWQTNRLASERLTSLTQNIVKEASKVLHHKA